MNLILQYREKGREKKNIYIYIPPAQRPKLAEAESSEHVGLRKQIGVDMKKAIEFA